MIALVSNAYALLVSRKFFFYEYVSVVVGYEDGTFCLRSNLHSLFNGESDREKMLVCTRRKYGIQQPEVYGPLDTSPRGCKPRLPNFQRRLWTRQNP